MIIKKKSFCMAAGIVFFYATLSLADNIYDPRISISGLGGSRFFGAGDAMLPISGDNQSLWYGDLQGQYDSNHNWTGSLGGGIRKIMNNAYFIGGYTYADYNNADDKGHFWFLSPGVEAVGLRWDAHLNTYLPVSSQTKTVARGFGDDLGIGSSVTFSGHDQYDHLYKIYDSVGPGIDIDGGYRWSDEFPVTTHLGAYHFKPKEGDGVTGGRLQISYPLNHQFTLLAENSYDNLRHNTFMAGLRVTFGGLPHDTQPLDISDRMLDATVRNLASTGRGNSVPLVRSTQDTGTTALERSNIYFFTNNGGNAFDTAAGTANCTYEHPCNGSGFTQSAINAINNAAANANFYFNGGAYNAINSSSGLTLNNGQSIYGRNSDYTLAASGNDRPTFNGGFILNGNNTLDSIQLMNNAGTPLTQALSLNNATGVTLNNVLIGAMNATQGYGIGVLLDNSSININNSTINVFSQAPNNSSDIAYGIDTAALTSNTINLNNSVINMGGVTGSWRGINAVDDLGLTLNLNNSQINAAITGGGSGNTYGVFYSGIGTSAITLNDSSINLNSNAADSVIGISSAAQDTAITLNNSAINVTHTTTGSNLSYGIAASGSGDNQVTLNHSAVNVSATSSAGNVTAYGIFTESSAGNNDVTLTNNSSVSATAVAANNVTAIDISLTAAASNFNHILIQNSSLSLSAASTGGGTVVEEYIDTNP